MKVIGLCGGSGSGKGTVSSFFSEAGIPVIDTDAIYHELTSHSSDCLSELVAEFGEEIIKDGALDRGALASIVFSSSDSDERRLRLNRITHRYILDEAEKRLSVLAKQGSSIAVVDAPLLFESGFDKRCDVTVAVIADNEKRVERIVMRDGISRERALERISSQIQNADLVSLTDYQIYNSTSLSVLRESVLDLIEKITKCN
ncbi:MAG: dephospho-CoA kinase [Clostridia bacterium]|nr:dephospho-CoA kinase [Clostridia bacterium]